MKSPDGKYALVTRDEQHIQDHQRAADQLADMLGLRSKPNQPQWSMAIDTATPAVTVMAGSGEAPSRLGRSA